MKKYYFDTETETIYTRDDLRKLFAEMVAEDASYETESFTEWMNDCTSKNGSLTEIPPYAGSYTFEHSLSDSLYDRIAASGTDAEVILLWNMINDELYPFIDRADRNLLNMYISLKLYKLEHGKEWDEE